MDCNLSGHIRRTRLAMTSFVAFRLGEGSFGFVVAAKDTMTGKRVAIKKIKDAVVDGHDGKR
jgi:hypothetical protein